jgi:hypothetical protein
MMGENIAQLNAIQKNETQNDFEEWNTAVYFSLLRGNRLSPQSSFVKWAVGASWSYLQRNNDGLSTVLYIKSGFNEFI